MKTIASDLIERIEKNGGKFLEYSSVWDVHNSSIGQSKNSNVYTQVKRILEKNPKMKINAFVGAKGRTQHSASEVLLFDTTNMSHDDFVNAGFYYSGTEFTYDKKLGVL